MFIIKNPSDNPTLNENFNKFKNTQKLKNLPKKNSRIFRETADLLNPEMKSTDPLKYDLRGIEKMVYVEIIVYFYEQKNI